MGIKSYSIGFNSQIITVRVGATSLYRITALHYRRQTFLTMGVMRGTFSNIATTAT